MKSIPKLIRRFVGIMTLSTILLIILNLTFFAAVFVRNTSAFSPWDMAEHAADTLQLTDGGYSISDDVSAKLKEENAWAMIRGRLYGGQIICPTISLCSIHCRI